jgi:hypothetical protein
MSDFYLLAPKLTNWVQAGLFLLTAYKLLHQLIIIASGFSLGADLFDAFLNIRPELISKIKMVHRGFLWNFPCASASPRHKR